MAENFEKNDTPKQFEPSIDKEDWINEHNRILDENERILPFVEKLPDDTPVYIGYQYKSRDQYTEELLSAKEAVELLEYWLKHGFKDINNLQVKAFSVEDVQAFKERMERESRAASEERKREDAENARRRLFELRRVESHADIELVLDPKLEKDKNRGIAAAIRFVDTLKESVEQPKDYADERKEASGTDKLTHEGWKEHDDLKRAFQSATRIESRVRLNRILRGKKYYIAEVFFADKDGKEIMTIRANVDQDGELDVFDMSML